MDKLYSKLQKLGVGCCECPEGAGFVGCTRWLMSKNRARGMTCREDEEEAREGGESWMALTLDL